MTIRSTILKATAAAAFLAAAPAYATNSGYPVEWEGASTASFTQTTATRISVPSPGLVLPAGWNLAFSEEFGAASIGGESSVGVTWFAPIHSQLGVGKMAQPGDPAIAVMGGNLILQTRNPNQAGGVDANIQSANAAGKGFFFQNGYVEARMKLPTAHGSHAGFWLLSMHDTKQGHGEIDVLEAYGQQDSRGHHASAHWWPGTKSAMTKHVYNSNIVKVAADLQTEWHTFGAMLDANYVTIYYDRVQIGRIARLPEQQVPFYLVLSCFTDPNRTDGYEPATMLVDYVKVWTAPAAPRDVKVAKAGQ